MDYHFLSKEQFQQHIQSGDFFEWAEVYGNFYGTLKLGKIEVYGNFLPMQFSWLFLVVLKNNLVCRVVPLWNTNPPKVIDSAPSHEKQKTKTKKILPTEVHLTMQLATIQ